MCDYKVTTFYCTMPTSQKKIHQNDRTTSDIRSLIVVNGQRSILPGV